MTEAIDPVLRGRINRLLRLLASEKADKRYEACEELRVTAWLPPDALAALSAAAQDSNREVAEAAQNALSSHTAKASLLTKPTEAKRALSEEVKLAKEAYGWLRLSPLITVFTFVLVFVAAYSSLPSDNSELYTSHPGLFSFYIPTAIAILGSALWHLRLLSFIRNRDSDFVRWHGRQALLLAGIRTATCLLFLAIDAVSGYALFYWVILVLIFMWAFMSSWGNRQVEMGTCALALWFGREVAPSESPISVPSVAQSVIAVAGVSQSTTRESTMSESQEQVLEGIWKGLRSDDPNNQLTAIHELSKLTYSSQAIVSELEKLGVSAGKAVRQPALNALDFASSQDVRSQMLNHLNASQRLTILTELEDWQERGLVKAEEAEVLLRRYDFRRKPLQAQKPAEVAAVKSVPVQVMADATQAAVSNTSKPVTTKPPEPRPTLSERLLSQSTINIALYLGAFLVIGAAVILAALVEVTRVPILVAVSLLFAGGSFALKKRLPQPSFILFIVFSVLLPITAGVIAQTYNLSGRVGDAYWTAVFCIMALIWGFGTWFYTSRLLSLAAFVAWALTFLKFGSIFTLAQEWNILSLVLASVTGLLGVHVLRGWKDSKFALPLFVLTQLVIAGTSLWSMGLVMDHIFNGTIIGNMWLATTLTWFATAAFYAWSGVLYTFPPFAWAATAALLPGAWLIFKTIGASTWPQVFSLWGWGVVFAAGSEFFGRSAVKQARDYHWPFLLGTLCLFVVSSSWAFVEDLAAEAPISYLLGIFLGTSVVYAILAVLRPRSYVWLTALIFGLAGYFTIFGLPAVSSANIYAGTIFVGASLLLIVPELFFKSGFTLKSAWRWPLVSLGTLVTVIGLLIVLFDEQLRAHSDTAIMGVYALLFAACALHFRRGWIGYLATAAATIAVHYYLLGTPLQTRLDGRLAILTGVAALYFVAGAVLRGDKTRIWGSMLRISGLALGTILCAVALDASSGYSRLGWGVLVVSALFFSETYIRSEDRMEASGPLFASLAAILLLRQFGRGERPFLLLACSLIWLGADLVYRFTLKRRRLAAMTRLIGGALALANLPVLIVYGYPAGYPDRAAAIFGIYVCFFTAYALLYRKWYLGLAATGSLAFAILLTLRQLHLDLWLPVLTGLSALYFIAGYWLRVEKTKAWGDMLRISSLALGACISVAAVILQEGGGEWYVLLIGLFFFAEIYLRRESRLEVGAPLLFSMAAYLVLHDLRFTTLSYLLLVIGLIWLGADVVYKRTLESRPWATATRFVGGGAAVASIAALLIPGTRMQAAAICFGVYAIFFAMYAWLYSNPRLGYIATVCLPLGVFFELQTIHQTNWLYEIGLLSALYYAAGYVLRARGKAPGWSQMLRFSGLGLGVINAASAPLHVGLDAAIPVAVAATLFAVEAFVRREVRLGFPANLLYLESYFLILIWQNVHQAQFFSIGAAILGMLMHYLLVRAGSKTGAFVTGMFSQLVLLGTTFIQLLSTQSLGFFVIIFFQGLAVLAYGIVARSRSLVMVPIIFIVASVLAVIYTALSGIATVVMIGCTGIGLLLLGIAAVVLRERFTQIGERLRDWQA